jgi:hypothetical protein
MDLKRYGSEDDRSVIDRLKTAVRGAVQAAAEEATNRPMEVNINIQINYARGGGATVNVK